MKKMFALLLVLVSGSLAFAKALPMMSPYEVVVPSLNGDPAGADRLAGQLYYDLVANAFKGIDGSGAVRTFSTGGSGAKVHAPNPTLTSSASTWEPVPFSAGDAQFDTNSYVGTDEFTVPADGIYTISGFASGGTVGPGHYVALRYKINGGAGVFFCTGTVSTVGYSHCNASELVQLNSGDVISFEATSTDNIATNVRFGIVKE